MLQSFPKPIVETTNLKPSVQPPLLLLQLLLILLPLGTSLQVKQGGNLSPSAHRSFWDSLLPKLPTAARAYSTVYSQSCAIHFVLVSCLALLQRDQHQVRRPASNRITVLLDWKG